MSFPAGYLVYHPKRKCSNFNGVYVHYDEPKHNQDPYVWNKQFLHSTCHITQMRTGPGQINFWVSGDTFPDFSKLLCDLVFVVESKIFWKEKNNIEVYDDLVDSENAYKNHYYHIPIDHPYKKKRRYTLKADENLSFQPQSDANGNLVDILPFLLNEGYNIKKLQKMFISGVGSKPIPLEVRGIVESLYATIVNNATVKLYGEKLEKIYYDHPQLESP
ncbi:hypothetical protein ACQKND_09150 [Viridibacillus arvi]|uniref:hypothetical protein n=1 Tax=Viridibacillus arvi TaxID=263475 RepID=UPI003CFE2541